MTDMLQTQPAVLAFGGFPGSPERLNDRFVRIYDQPLIVLDLTGVDTIDPAFLSEMAQLRVHRREKGLLVGRLVIDSQHVRSALRAVGFERHWPIYETLDEAVASFEGPPIYA